MAKCPDCERVLINKSQCECGWRAPGVFDDHKQQHSQCDTEGCTNHYTIRTQSGAQFCSECLDREADAGGAGLAIEKYRDKLKTLVENFDMNSVKIIKPGRVSTPAGDEMHRTIARHQEMRRREKEALVQEEPGADG